MPAHFEDIEVGQVVSLGVMRLTEDMLESFNEAFAPERDVAEGASDALVYAVWASLDARISAEWPQTKRLGVDAAALGAQPAGGRGPARTHDHHGQGPGRGREGHRLRPA